METTTLHEIDIQRRAELGEHAALLLRLNGRDIPRPSTAHNVIRAAINDGLLNLEPALRRDIGL